MPAYQTVVERHEDDMPKVIRVELPEGRKGAGWAWPNDSLRWRAAYEARWFEDFLDRWRRTLLDERWVYRAKLACVDRSERAAAREEG